MESTRPHAFSSHDSLRPGRRMALLMPGTEAISAMRHATLSNS